jgi:hypothetical protein
MVGSMSYTQDDLAAIRGAIASGARRVRLQGVETEFRSLDEMLRIEALIRDSLAASQSTGGVLFTSYTSGT